MTLTRIYVPLTPSMVRALADTREIARVPIPAHAVTQRLERAHPTADEEEREYAALCEAADAAGALSAGSVVRRVVVAADVDSTWVDSRRGEGSDVLSTVDITEPVPLRLVASFHVDEVPGQDDDELLWYDVTELPEVVRLAGA